MPAYAIFNRDSGGAILFVDYTSRSWRSFVLAQVHEDLDEVCKRRPRACVQDSRRYSPRASKPTPLPID